MIQSKQTSILAASLTAAIACASCAALPIQTASATQAGAGGGSGSASAGSSSSSATLVPIPSEDARVWLAQSCPTVPTGSESLIGDVVGGVLSTLAGDIFDTFGAQISKAQADLSASTAYTGYSTFYGGTDSSTAPPKMPAGCIIIAKLDGSSAPSEGAGTAFLNKAIARLNAADPSTVGKKLKFYSEIAIQPVRIKSIPASTGKKSLPPAMISYGFRLSPQVIYMNATDAKSSNDDEHSKSLLLTVQMTRLDLTKGAMADKPFVSATFNVGKFCADEEAKCNQSAPANDDSASAFRIVGNGTHPLKVQYSSLYVWPQPAQIDPTKIVLLDQNKQPYSEKIVDNVMVLTEVDVAEAGKPGMIEAAIAEAYQNNKAKMTTATQKSITNTFQ